MFICVQVFGCLIGRSIRRLRAGLTQDNVVLACSLRLKCQLEALKSELSVFYLRYLSSPYAGKIEHDLNLECELFIRLKSGSCRPGLIVRIARHDSDWDSLASSWTMLQ